MKAYATDFRQRVLAMCDKGRSTGEVAQAFGVSKSWVRLIKQLRREEGRLGPKPGGGRRHGHFDAVGLLQLESWLREHPDATLEWLRGRVLREMQVRCSLMGVCRAVKKLGWSLKKKRFERPSRTARTSPGDV